MAFFRYKVLSSNSKDTHEILIEADSNNEAVNKIKARNLIPISFLGEADLPEQKHKRSKIDTVEFTRQLSPLLNASIPLERALAIIADGAVTKEQQDFVSQLRQGLHEGKKFSSLVRSYGKLFPGYYANLIESGEETGCLSEVVQELYRFMSETKELKNFIVSSSIYPLAILGVTLAVTVLLFTVFVPRFAKIFIDMGRELPPAMVLLNTAGEFLFWAWWLVPLIIYGIYQLALKRFGENTVKKVTAELLLKLPLLGSIIRDLEVGKYFRTMAIMLANHVEIIKTVKIAGKIITNPVILSEFEGIDRKLKSGDKLSSALKGNNFIPKETIPMLRVGEESGDVGHMLQMIALNMENETRLKIKRLLSLFEPAVIVFLAVLVLSVVISIFVAMMEINSIGQGGPSL